MLKSRTKYVPTKWRITTAQVKIRGKSLIKSLSINRISSAFKCIFILTKSIFSSLLSVWGQLLSINLNSVTNLCLLNAFPLGNDFYQLSILFSGNPNPNSKSHPEAHAEPPEPASETVMENRYFSGKGAKVWRV